MARVLFKHVYKRFGNVAVVQDIRKSSPAGSASASHSAERWYVSHTSS